MEPPQELVAKLTAPRPSQLIYREECTLCFNDQDGPLGIDLCLSCYNGSCPAGSSHNHSALHFQHTGHSIFVNIRRTKKELAKTEREESEPPMKKLAIRQELSEHEQFEFQTQLRMYDGDKIVDLAENDHLREIVNKALNSMTSSQQTEVKAWEEEINTCTHAQNLVQAQPMKIERAGLAECAFEGCDLKNNLWLCLVCGALGCGRQQFGGGGGHGHGVQHAQSTGHSIAVKMGTIQPDGTADLYCYSCDDATLDPNLATNLANFGIQVAEEVKTEKSMTELQIEQNLKFDFAMTGADGKELEPVTGPGLTGLRNLGNSCYLASSLQTLFSLPEFQTRYLTSFLSHVTACHEPIPAECFECQMAKMAQGLLSGEYSVQAQHADNEVGFQAGIRPNMFKNLIGRGHVEFSTMGQQDAGEFLIHLLETIRRSNQKTGLDDVTNLFSFELEERLECRHCHRVRYNSAAQDLLPIAIPVEPKSGDASKFEEVKIERVLENFVQAQSIEYKCPVCDENVEATKQTRFGTLPKVLLVNAARFQLDGWVPKKVDVPLIIPKTGLNFDLYMGKGLQPHEIELPESKTAQTQEISFDPTAISQLQEFGFPLIRAQRALVATNHQGAEAAMNWLFQHMEDENLDAPLENSAPSAAAAEFSDEQISALCDMGFTRLQSVKALKETGADANRAVEWLFSHPEDSGEEIATTTTKTRPGRSDLPANYRLKAFISHKGPSVHSGHYVAHILTKENGWILFNDEKVVKAEKGAQSAYDLMPFAYIYAFERVDSQK